MLKIVSAACALMAVSLGGCGQDNRPANNVQPEDCHQALDKAAYNSLEFSSGSEKTAWFRRLAINFMEQHKDYTINSASGLKVGVDAITVEGSNDYNSRKLYDLIVKVVNDEGYVITDKDWITIKSRSVNDETLKAWVECLKLAAGRPEQTRLVSERVDDKRVVVRAIIGAGKRAPRVKNVSLSGATFESGEPEVGAELSPNHEIHLNNIPGVPVHLVIQCDTQSVACHVAAVTPPVVAPEPQPVVDEKAYTLANEEYQKRKSEYESGTEYPGQWAQRHGPGTIKSTTSLPIGGRIVGIQSGGSSLCDTFHIVYQNPDGSIVEDGWLNGPSRAKAAIPRLNVPSGCYIVGYRMQHGDRSDAFYFVLNNGTVLGPVGGTGGGTSKPASGWHSGPSDGYTYELSRLEIHHGDTIDGVRGYFRRVFTKEQLTPPKREDFVVK